MSGQTWVDYILVITEILAIAAALLLLCLGWVTYQRRQIRVARGSNRRSATSCGSSRP